MATEDGYYLGRRLAGMDLSDPVAVTPGASRLRGARRPPHGPPSSRRQAYKLGQLFHHSPRILAPLRDAFFDHTPFLQKVIGESTPGEIVNKSTRSTRPRRGSARPSPLTPSHPGEPSSRTPTQTNRSPKDSRSDHAPPFQARPRAGLTVVAASSLVMLAACGGRQRAGRSPPTTSGAEGKITLVFSPLALKIPAMQGLTPRASRPRTRRRASKLSVQDPNLDPQKQATDLQSVVESGKAHAVNVIAVALPSLWPK